MTDIWPGLIARFAVLQDLVDVLVADENGGIETGAGFVQNADHPKNASEEHGIHVDQPEADVVGRFTADDGLAFFEPAAQLFLEPRRHDEIGVLIESDHH